MKNKIYTAYLLLVASLYLLIHSAAMKEEGKAKLENLSCRNQYSKCILHNIIHK